MRRWKFIPRIKYVNYRKEYPISEKAFSKWLTITRYWFGRIISITVKHHELSFDFRKNWLYDMVKPG